MYNIVHHNIYVQVIAINQLTSDSLMEMYVQNNVLLKNHSILQVINVQLHVEQQVNNSSFKVKFNVNKNVRVHIHINILQKQTAYNVIQISVQLNTSEQQIYHITIYSTDVNQIVNYLLVLLNIYSNHQSTYAYKDVKITNFITAPCSVQINVQIKSHMLKKTKNNANNYVKQDNIEKMEKQMFVSVVVVPQNINIMMHKCQVQHRQYSNAQTTVINTYN